MKTATRKTTGFELSAGLRRGDAMPTGGRFVGNAGSIWVCYGDDEEFRQMCENFDRIYSSRDLASVA